MCDERTDHTGRCRPLLSNLHSFTPYCDIGPASEDISCSVRPLRCFRFVPLPCSCFPFEIMLTETLLQGTFGTGQDWPRRLVDQPGSCPNAFLRSSNSLDSVQVWTRRTTHLRSPATLSSAANPGNLPQLGGECGWRLPALFSCSCWAAQWYSAL